MRTEIKPDKCLLRAFNPSIGGRCDDDDDVEDGGGGGGGGGGGCTLRCCLNCN